MRRVTFKDPFPLNVTPYLLPSVSTSLRISLNVQAVNRIIYHMLRQVAPPIDHKPPLPRLGCNLNVCQLLLHV